MNKKIEYCIKNEIFFIKNTSYYFLSLFDRETKELLDFKIANAKKLLAQSETERLISKLIKEKSQLDNSFTFFLERKELNLFKNSGMLNRLKNNWKNFNINFLEKEDSISLLSIISLEELEEIWKDNLDVKKNKKALLEKLKRKKIEVDVEIVKEEGLIEGKEEENNSVLTKVERLKTELEKNFLDDQQGLILYNKLNKFADFLSDKISTEVTKNVENTFKIILKEFEEKIINIAI